MLKFKFNYQENTLAYQKPFELETWYEIALENQFQGGFGSSGFAFDQG
jgi:hypothetical protein